MADFVHLHNHSDFSLLDAAQTVDTMCNRVYDLKMDSIALLLQGDTGNKIINFQDYNAQTIGIIFLWLSAALTLFTGYDYMRKGIDHAMSEDNKH